MSASCRSLGSFAQRNVHLGFDLTHPCLSLLPLEAILEFGMPTAKGAAEHPLSVVCRVAQNSGRGPMRSGKFEWHGCVAPIPKDAFTEFEKSRGEFCAYPTGHWEISQERRATCFRHRCAGAARPNQRETAVANIVSGRLSKATGPNRIGVHGKPSTGARRFGRPFVSVFLWCFVASASRCQRRLGIDSISAIARSRGAGHRRGTAGEN